MTELNELTELTGLSLAGAASAVRNREVSAVELVDACLTRIDATEPSVSAFASVQADAARARAEWLDRSADQGPLHGVPVALKDLVFTEGVPAEANCGALRGFVPDRDAAVAARLQDAGAVIVGKTNTHELAFGVSCPDSYNPWDRRRSTGGSSGGSAAALAARQVYGALGSDTGGSVRIPSNCCGTTGIKTTRGAVPRDGVHLISWTYDTVGPMARSAEDCGILLEVVAGRSASDPYSAATPLSEPADPRGLVLGVPDDGFFEGIDIDPQVLATMEAAVDVLGTIAAQVRPATVPNSAEHAEIGLTIVIAEAAALLEDLRTEHGDLIGEEVRDVLGAGAGVPGTVLARAQSQRVAFEQAWGEVFEDQGVDLVIAPVNPNQTVEHGAAELDGVPLIPATTQFTFPINGAGLPAIALPGGFAADGLPIGFQLIGRPFAERTLIAVGEAFQRATDHHLRVPRDLARA